MVTNLRVQQTIVQQCIIIACAWYLPTCSLELLSEHSCMILYLYYLQSFYHPLTMSVWIDELGPQIYITMILLIVFFTLYEPLKQSTNYTGCTVCTVDPFSSLCFLGGAEFCPSLGDLQTLSNSTLVSTTLSVFFITL